MSTLAFRIADKRVAAVEQLVNELVYEQAEYARDVDELVDETAKLLEPARRVFTLLELGIQFDTTEVQFIFAHNVGHLLNRTLTLFERIRELTADVHRLGYEVEGIGPFDEAESELRRYQTVVSQGWLLPDRASVNAAKRAVAEGRIRVL